MIYPNDWAPVENSSANTRLKLRSDFGDGGADFGVIAIRGAKNEKATPDEILNYVYRNPDSLLNAVRTGVPDAKLLSMELTYVNNRRALATKYNGTFKSLEQVSRLTYYQLSIPFENVTYTLTFRCPQAEFDTYLPKFNAIAKGFTIRPTIQ